MKIHVWEVFFNDFRSLWGQSCKKGQNNYEHVEQLAAFWEAILGNLVETVGIYTNTIFSYFFCQKWPQPPPPSQKEYSGGSGSQKAPKMEPTMDTLGDL